MFITYCSIVWNKSSVLKKNVTVTEGSFDSRGLILYPQSESHIDFLKSASPSVCPSILNSNVGDMIYLPEAKCVNKNHILKSQIN